MDIYTNHNSILPYTGNPDSRKVRPYRDERVLWWNVGTDGTDSAFPLRCATGHSLFQLPNPFLQELPLRFLLGQRQSFLIRSPSLSGPAQPAVQIGTGRMRQVVICQFAMFQHRVDMLQSGLWAIAHGNGHGTIEMGYRRRVNSHQLVVKRNNLPPVGRSGRFRFSMNGRDRSLQRVSTEAAGVQGLLHQGPSLRDLLPVPERAVLIVQQNQLSGRRGSRGATGFLEQHQGKQPHDFRLWDFRLWLEFGQ